MSKWVTTKDYEGECRREHNGLSKLTWTVMLAACGVVFIGYTGWMANLTSKIDTIQAMSLTREGHLGSVMSQLVDVKGRQDRLETYLARIEHKIDTLAEKKR